MTYVGETESGTAPHVSELARQCILQRISQSSAPCVEMEQRPFRDLSWMCRISNSSVKYFRSYFAESGNGEGRVAVEIAANTNCVTPGGVA